MFAGETWNFTISKKKDDYTMRVFVLLFNARTENEGIHTIWADNRNKVLIFESEDDATRLPSCWRRRISPPHSRSNG